MGIERGTPEQGCPTFVPAWLSNPNQWVFGWVALFGCDTCLIKLVKVSGYLISRKIDIKFSFLPKRIFFSSKYNFSFLFGIFVAVLNQAHFHELHESWRTSLLFVIYLLWWQSYRHLEHPCHKFEEQAEDCSLCHYYPVSSVPVYWSLHVNIYLDSSSVFKQFICTYIYMCIYYLTYFWLRQEP